MVVLLVILLGAGGAFLYMQTRKPSLTEVQAAIDSGELWNQPLDNAKDVFGVEPTQVPREERDSPSAERWLFKVHSSPPTYFLVFVQNGVVTQAQPADASGQVLPK